MFRHLATLLMLLVAVLAPLPATAQQDNNTYSGDDIVAQGSAFFGSAAQGLAQVVENAVSQYGQPNGYILGEEAGGAIFIGARYGEGVLYTRNAGQLPLYWQGPSVGLDVGGDGSKVMMLVYNLQTVNDVFRRIVGVDGSAYVVGGVGMTVLKDQDIVVVPIRSGVGARLGINIGYLNFTQQPTWNPF